MGTLDGKTALVTGASRGIGRGIATRLAADGARVVVHYGTNKVAADETVATITAAGGGAVAIGADLSADDGVDVLFTALRAELAGAPLDIVVNNAGIGRSAPMEATTRAMFDELFAVNARAPFFVIQRALDLLPDGGRIINIGSAVASTVAISIEPAYAMTKGAIEALSRTMAAGLGRRGITVNTVTPGMTDTDLVAEGKKMPGFIESIEQMTTLERLGQPSDIAAAVAFLASDDGRWVTGHTLNASGGMWLGPRI